MADQTPLLGLPHILPSQAQKHVTHNEALIVLDAVVQLAVLDRTQATPPAAPMAGDRYIVAAGGTSEWFGHDTEVALYTENGWIFAVPKPGWSARDLASNALIVFDGALWAEAVQSTDNLVGVGINASHDTANRLVSFADATLLSHDGAGHQLKVNKALPSDTASLLFQTSWSGRAEMGTNGNDDFSVKVSADGAGWTTALSFDAATGFASGAAVQQSKTDTTAQRLMRADYGYGPGNLLGPVIQNGGVPDGAVLERGANASGEYLRLADGTQICVTKLVVGSVVAVGSGSWDAPYESAEVSWTFPAPFAAAPVLGAQAVAPSGVAAARRRAMAHVGETSATAATGIHVTRLGADSTADTFSVDLMAFGRWF